MEITKINPELQNASKRFPRLHVENRILYPIIKWLSRLQPKAKSNNDVIVSHDKIGSIKLQIFTPKKPLNGALLWIHGGGFVMGSHHMNESECQSYAKKFSLLVISVDYRLAPKHPFPAALQDCIAAWDWLLEQSPKKGFDKTRVLIAGQSAGGGLAANLTTYLVENRTIRPLAQVLFYPMLDDRTTENTLLTAENHFVWNNVNNQFAWTAYLGKHANDSPFPKYAVPARHENLSDLPSTWIGVGSADLFYLENVKFSQRLIAAQVPCQIDVALNAPHAFDSIAPNAKITISFMKKHYQFIKEALASCPIN